MIYFCCDEQRREDVRAHATLIGIDHLEVVDSPTMPAQDRQRTLRVHLIEDGAEKFPIKDGYAAALTVSNVVVLGGERIRDVKVTAVAVEAGQPRVLIVTVDRPGDFSTYTLRIVRSPQDHARLDDFDPLLSAVDFSFKVECPNDFDCLPQRACPPEAQPSPDINYLAKDYASFRRLMLDRMAALMPAWNERSTADLGIALVELLAYVGDHLSYQQDAIATEAYLGTARRRTSVRRHARLVDYRMHDGCNARAWVHVRVSGDTRLKPFDEATQVRTRFLTQCPIEPRVDDDQLPRVLTQYQPDVFEPMSECDLIAAHNEMRFYTWGARECCLPQGATRATLRDDPGNRLRLRTGDVLIFEERRGPRTGHPADADPDRRHVVRLVSVTPEAVVQDQGGVLVRVPGGLLTDPLTEQAIVEIAWEAEDALPFPVCISSTSDAAHDKQPVDDVSVALGNIVLADHGLTLLAAEPLGVAPVATIFEVPSRAGDRCEPAEPIPVPPRFNPTLAQRPLTHAAPHDPGVARSAHAAMHWQPHDALPVITLNGELDGKFAEWHPQRDLLNSNKAAREFVVETESDLTAALRFGDDVNGMRPQSGAAFTAVYRIGNGARGNVGADAIAHVVAANAEIAAVRNPLPARGGAEPERMEDVRQYAPFAFRTQLRAVTAEDYAEVTERNAQIQQAAATFRWTGSWRTAFITADRVGGAAVDEPFEAALRAHVEPFRMAGQDVEIDAPRHIPLEVTMVACVQPGYFRSDVKAALLDVFSARILPDGRRGLFHPDNFTFGQPVYLSQLYATAQAVEGVASVQITQFERKGQPSAQGIEAGKLAFARLEIPQLDNDPSFPERGAFHLVMQGGK